MQHEISKKQDLLDSKGNLNEPGFSKTEMFYYDRKQIKVGKSKIKEWDYYYIGNNEHGICLTIADNGYVGSLGVSHLDYNKRIHINKSSLLVFPMGKVKMPNTSKMGDVSYESKVAKITFLNDGTTRHLFGTYKKFVDGKDLEFDIKLFNFPEESMYIATPFKKKKHFYYNQKINNMEVDGYYKIGDEKYLLNKENKSLGLLDWGRGVWTYSNTWYWGSLSSYDDKGNTIGFNIGYGFGDTSAASENMIIYNGKAHKLDLVDFNIPGDNSKKVRYLDPWHLTSNDNRLDLHFEPLIDRYDPINIGLICLIPHQVFGKFSGTLVLDDGSKVEIKDAMGFAEKVHNRW